MQDHIKCRLSHHVAFVRGITWQTNKTLPQSFTGADNSYRFLITSDFTMIMTVLRFGLLKKIFNRYTLHTCLLQEFYR